MTWTTIGARTLRAAELDLSYSATVDLPVLNDRGRWVCRTRMPELEVDRPMNDDDSLGALKLGLWMVALEWFSVERYMEVALCGNKGLPLGPPVETECAWPGSSKDAVDRSNAPCYLETGEIPECDVRLLAERAYVDAKNPQGDVLVYLRIYGSPEEPTRCRVELDVPALVAAYHYEVKGADSMEALEQALLTASVRLEFLMDRLSLRPGEPRLLSWKSGAKLCLGTGLPLFPDVPFSEAGRVLD